MGVALPEGLGAESPLHHGTSCTRNGGHAGTDYRTNIGRFETRLGQPGFFFTDIPNQTVLVLQGGGAIGAFECGVVRALEERSVYPDIVAGVSIGAFNGAIIAAHPRHATQALESFWHDVAAVSPIVGDEAARQLWSSTLVMLFGVPQFFMPRWWFWGTPLQHAFAPWTSFYDFAPARRLLVQYVDFTALKSSPVRLLVSAVNVETAQLDIFDSYVDDLTVDHLLASGSLPPALPWTTIGDRHYWDGGIVSNSPLDQVVERCGAAGKRASLHKTSSCQSTCWRCSHAATRSCTRNGSGGQVLSNDCCRMRESWSKGFSQWSTLRPLRESASFRPMCRSWVHRKRRPSHASSGKARQGNRLRVISISRCRPSRHT